MDLFIKRCEVGVCMKAVLPTLEYVNARSDLKGVCCCCLVFKIGPSGLWDSSKTKV